MKRILAMLLVFTFIPIISFAEVESDDVIITYAVDKDFEDDTLGTSPSGVTCWSRKEKIYTDIDENGNKYLKLEEVENGKENTGCFPEFGFGELEGTVVLEFKINFVVAGDGRFRLAMFDDELEEDGVMHIDANLNLCDLSWNPAGMQLAPNRSYEIATVIDQDEQKIDVYVDRRKKMSDISYKDGNGLSISKFRFTSYMIGQLGTGINPIIGLDDVRVYNSDKPIFMHELEGKNVIISQPEEPLNSYSATDGEIAKHMKNTVALFAGENKIAIDGEVSYLDPDDHTVSAKLINSRTMVPVRFVSEALEATVDWNEASEKVLIKSNGKTVEFNLNSSVMLVDGETVTLDAPPQMIANRVYVPIRALAEALGKKVYYDKSGMIVISDRDNFFNMQTDLGVYRTLAGNLVYDIPEPTEVVDAVKAKHPNNSHPRIMADSARFNQIKRNVQTDPIAKDWYEKIIKNADSYLTGTLTTKYTEGGNPHLVSSGYKQKIGTVALAYKLTGDTKYADRGIEILLAACSFDNWAPHNGLSLSDMCFTVAIGYDWLYDCLTVEQRKTVRDAIVKNGFNPLMAEYLNLPRESGYPWGQGKPDNFHFFGDGSGITLALAVCDEPDVQDLATEVLGNAMEHIRRAVSMFGPDGAWYEGPSYWAFLMVPYGTFVSSLEYAAGSTYGYLDVPGVEETCYFISAVTSPKGIFAYHDCYDELQTSPTVWYIAKHLNDYGIANDEMQRRQRVNTAPLFFDLLWYDPFPVENVNLKKDWYFRDAEIVTTRSSWSDDSVFAALHAGMNNVYHGHYDMGEFIIDAYNTRFAASLGRDTYDGVAAHRYRVRAEGTNTLVINPDKTAGQELRGISRIDRFESNEDSMIATIDMTSGYRAANKVIRGMKTFDNRQRIILQDEIETKEPSDIYWFMHTAQEIDILDNGKTARIYGNGKDMIARLTCDNDAVFSVMEAKPLETSPANPSTAYSNDAYQKLAIKLEDVTNTTLTVEFSFVASGIDETTPKSSVLPISEWTLSEVKPEAPQLYDLMLNCKTIDGFKPDKFIYESSIKDGEKLPKVIGRGYADITVEYPDDVPGYIVVRCASKEDPEVYNDYIIKISTELLVADEDGNVALPAGITKLAVASVSASDVPEVENIPENTLDGNLDTSWTAKGGPTITFDLGSVKDISYIGLAIKQLNNDGRRQIFNIYTSVDGENYTTISSNNYTTGTTLFMELFKIPKTKARYVMIKGKGSTVGTWNNISEVGIFGE